MMINTKVNSALQKQRFRNKLEECAPWFAYEILFLQIIVQDDQYHRKPTLEEISKLMQLYMMAVEVLQGAGDSRYDYFKRKIHILMLKKHIFQQMHGTKPPEIDMEILQNCAKADLELRKNQHEVQVFLNKTDNTKVQQILKKAQLQVKTFDSNIRKNIMTQELSLEQRIKNRKLKSESGSVHKIKLQSHNAQAKESPKQPKNDPRMEYFDDYCQKKPQVAPNKNIRGVYGSIQKSHTKILKDYS